jgi:hypothetical protein
VFASKIFSSCSFARFTYNQDGEFTTESYEHGNETLGSIKGRGFLDQLCDCLLLKEDPAPWSLFVCLLVGSLVSCLNLLFGIVLSVLIGAPQ